MAKTKKQNQEESKGNIISLVIGFLLIFTVAYCSASKPTYKNTSKPNVKIITQSECAGKYVDSYKSICGIVQNNGSERAQVLVKADYYDSDNIKVYNDNDFITIDGNGGKTRFHTTGIPGPYSKYRVYID